ncbi:hypothetical protein D3C72_1897070 [compost metagenome]
MDDFYRRQINQLKSLCESLSKQEISLDGFVEAQWQVIELVQHVNTEFWQTYRNEVRDLEILLAARIDSPIQIEESDNAFIQEISVKLSEFLTSQQPTLVKLD